MPIRNGSIQGLLNVCRRSFNSSRIDSLRNTKCLSTSSATGNIHPTSYSISEVTIPVPGGVIAGKLWEPEKRDESIPPVICVHGWLDNAGSFSTLLPLLLPTVATPFFCMDSPGHGLTTYCSQWFYDGWVDAMVAVQRSVKHLGWDKYSWLGHSMGSISGFIASGIFPEEIHKYVALDIMAPPVYDYLDTLRSSIDLVFEVEERARVPRKAFPFETLVERFYEGRMGTVNKEGCRILLQRGSECVDPTKDAFRLNYNLRTLIPGQEGRIQVETAKQIASRISCPVCYIKADPGNKYWEEDDLQKIFQIIRDSNGNRVETHLVPGSHHFHLNSPHLLAPIISSFLLTSS